MPIYEYRCKSCGKDFETIQKFSDAPLTSCIYCSGEVKRLISQSAFVLKGSGWYATDYAKKDKEARDRSKAECPAAGEKPSCESCPSS